MSKIFFTTSLFILFYQFALSQTNNFFPLSIGNEYQYHNGDNYWYGVIERDTLYPSGKLYFSLPYDLFYFGDTRVDSNGNILSASKPFFINGEPEEYLLFKANAQWGEVWPVAWNYNVVIDTGYARCIYDDSLYIFGEKRRVKGTLIYDNSYYYYYFWLAEGIGLIREQFDDGTVNNLNYAKINGIIYGTLVSVEEEIHQIPSEFYVSQNYPNPFNGVTQIEVRLPYSSYNNYKLLIHNILGSLVYEKEFPVNNFSVIRINTDELKLSSGTYFYTILFSGKKVTKKFLLLK